MAQYIVKPDYKGTGNPTVLSDKDLEACTHAILIRTPERAVPSYYRCCTGEYVH